MIPIDEVVHLDIITRDPETLVVSDADSTPTFAVFEEATDTPILSAQNFTKRTSLTGNYRGSFTASAANGFEVGKWYTVIASATVNGYADKDVVAWFRCGPAEAQAGYPKVDTQYLEGVAADDAEDVAAAVRTELTTELGRLDAAVSSRSTVTTAQVNTEVDTALADIHLDHLLATTYDPASKPGAADALLNELVENDGGVARYTANALEQGPSGGGGVADWTADERTALRSILGIPASGTTPADPTTGILDTIRDSVGTRSSQTSVDDLPTNAELATALAAADDAILAAIAALNNLSQANVRTALGLASANLDTQLDALPTNTELATALASADDAVLAAIAALNNLSAAGVRTAIGLASANLDTQLDALPTAAENAAALLDLSNGIETSVTPRQAMRLILSAAAGKTSGGATTTFTIRNVGDTKDRITATVTTDGDRTAVTTDAT